MASIDPIRVKDMWLNVQSQVLDIRPLKLDIYIELPEKKLGAVAERVIEMEGTKKGEEAAYRVMSRFESKVDEAVDSLLELAQDQYKADQAAADGVKGAAKKVRDEVDRVNRLIETHLNEIRVELRVAVAKAYRLDPKQLITRGSEKFTKIALRLGLFKEDDGEATTEFEDLEKQLQRHKGDWLFCAVAANGTKAFVQVDAKRRVEKKVVEDLKNHVGGSAQKVRGICNVKGTKLVFYLSKNAKKKPQKVHINNGLKDQIKDKVYKVEDVFFTLDEVPESKAELNAVVKQLKQGD